MSTPPTSVADSKAPAGSFRIGSIASIPLYLSSMWPFAAIALFALATTMLRPVMGVNFDQKYLLALSGALVLSLFLAVLLHEFSHALVARWCGLRVHHITLTPLGGYTYATTYAPTPATTALVGIAGPAANVALWLLALPLANLMPSQGWYLLVANFALVNKWLALFNLLPGLPLDGGHLTTAAVWAVTKSHTRGLRAGLWAGRFIAVATMIYFALTPVSGNFSVLDVIWTAMIGWFMWQATAQLARQIRTRELLDTISAAGLSRPAIVVGQSTFLADAYQSAPDLRTTLLVWDGSTILGWVPPVVLDQDAANSRVDTLMQPCDGTVFDVTLTTPVTDLAIGMAMEQTPALALRLPSGEPRLLALVDVDAVGLRQAKSAASLQQ
ncbi:MAG: site-2 protease family protein [Propionibacteriaceae bacterium]